MKNMRVFSAITAGILVASLTACSSGSSGSTSASSDNQKADAPVRIWFMEGSVPDAAQKYLVDEFQKEHPKEKISVEIQPWKDIKAKMQTALASDDQSPDIVEVGSGPDPMGTSGAFVDLSDMFNELGGSDLIPAFAKGGTYDGKHMTIPFYGGVRGIFYRKDLFQKAGVAVPKTLTDLKDAVIELQKKNPDNTPNFSGMYLSGIDYHALESWLYASGGRYAEQENGKWVGTLEKPEAQKALKEMQDVFRNGTRYALDSQAGQKQFENYFNDGKVGLLVATGNKGDLLSKKMWDADQIGVMPLPSNTPGEIGASYAGGSNLAMATKGLNHKGAKEALKIIYGEKFQTMLADAGWIPGNLKYADHVSGKLGSYSKEIMEKAVTGPQTVNMGIFYRNQGLQNFWARIAKLEDPAKAAADMDKQFNEQLNRKN